MALERPCKIFPEAPEKTLQGLAAVDHFGFVQ